MSIGATLAAARRCSGLTLSDVTAATRIREPVLEAIEGDDFASCGGDFYARAHIRSVAKAVGVDPEPLLAEYDEWSGAPRPPAAHEIFEPDVMPARRHGPNWSAALAVALLIVVGYGIVALLTSDGSDGAGPAVTTAAPAGAARENGSARSRGAAGTQGPAADGRAAGDQVELQLALSGESWVKATGTDGERLFQGLLQEGDRKVFRHPEGIRLVVGNAGAVRLTVNGYDVGSPGEDGGVLRATYRPGRPDGLPARS